MTPLTGYPDPARALAKVAPISEQAAALFYGRLFEIAPEVKPLFRGDMKGQGLKLMETSRSSSTGSPTWKPFCRPRARSPRNYVATASRRNTTPRSAPRCCGRWSAASAQTGRRTRRSPGRPPTRPCPDTWWAKPMEQRGGGMRQSGRKRSPMSEPLVIIGNGMAAARLVDELSARALGRYAVAVLGEGRPAYNRVLLSSLLADEIDRGEIELKPARWWRDRGVTLLYGCARPRSIRQYAGCGSRAAQRCLTRNSCWRPARSRSAWRSPAWICRAC